MNDRMALEVERHTLLCSIERCRHIVGLKRDVERLKSRLAMVDHQLAVDYDSTGASVFLSGRPNNRVPDEVLMVGSAAEAGRSPNEE